jgi:protein O-mannosyl-transferase
LPNALASFLSSDRRSAIALLCLAFIALLYIYVPSLSGALMFDDALLTSDRFATMYGNFRELHVRWLSYGSFVWLKSLFGESWVPQRVFNIALHVANCALLFEFFRRLIPYFQLGTATSDSPVDVHKAALFPLALGVAWFALAPVAVYGVAYLTQRSILMATLFTLVMWIAVIRAAETRRVVYWVLALLAYVAAMLSKEYALMAPAVALALFIVVRRPNRSLLVSLFAGLSVVGAIAIYALFKKYGYLIGVPFDEVSIAALKQLDSLEPGVQQNAWTLSILNQCALFFEYGVKWFAPLTQSMAIDLRPAFPTRLYDPVSLLSALGFGALLVCAAVGTLRHRDWRGFVALCFLIPTTMFVTEFATVWIQDSFVLYRSYLWAIAVPGLLYLCFTRFPDWARVAAAACVLLLLPVQALDRVETFSTSFASWDDAIKKLPGKLTTGQSRVFLNRGQALLTMNQPQRALMDFRRSTLLGDQGEGLLNTGVVLLAAGRPAEALDALDGSIKRGQSSAALYFNRGMAQLQVGQMADAVSSFTAALGAGSERDITSQILAQRSIALAQLARKQESLTDALRAVDSAPRTSLPHTALGFAYFANGESSLSIAAFTRSLEIERSTLALRGRAQVKALAGDASALDDVDAAVALSPGDRSLAEIRERLMSRVRR